MNKIFVAVSVVVLLILGGLCCNKMSTSVWAMPFIHGREIAVFKTTSRNDSIEKYYTLLFKMTCLDSLTANVETQNGFSWMAIISL